MGDWNEVCLISRMPIREGDRIVVIFLRKNPALRLEKDAYIPLGLPIRGKYDGYGGIEYIEDTASNNEAKRYLGSLSIKGTSGGKEEDVDLLDVCGTQGLFLRTDENKEYPLDMVYIKESVYDEIVGYARNDKSLEYSKTYEESVKDALSKLAERYRNMNTPGTYEYRKFEAWGDEYDDKFKFFWEHLSDGYANFLVSVSGDMYGYDSWEIGPYLLKKVLNGEDVGENTELLLEMSCYKWALKLLNMCYNGRPNPGAQYGAVGLQLKLAQLVEKEANERIKEDNEDDIERF